MRTCHLLPRVLAALLLATLFNLAARPAHAGLASGPSYAFSWQEGPRLQVVEYWNAPDRAGCDYAGNPWPRAQLAAQRAYVLGARQVLRDEWDIGAWIANNRAATSSARIHGAETNCAAGHVDWPPHVHIFFEAPDSSGAWREVNTHNYPNAQGKIDRTFVIPNLCATGKSYYPAANTWVDMPDETCAIAWQQRFTSAGDLELRRSASATVYTLRGRGVTGDLAGVDVLANGSLIYSLDVVSYDPVGEKMVAQIKDYRKHGLTTETWWGDAARGINLAGHTTQTAAWTPSVLSRHAFLPLLPG